MRVLLLLSLVACSANDDVPAPRLASVTPDHAAPGTSVTLEGEYFCQQPVESEDPLACAHIGTVSFGTLGTATTTYSDMQILAEVPNGAGMVRLTVTSAGRVSNSIDFTIE